MLAASVRTLLSVGHWFRLLLFHVLTNEPTLQCCFRREFWWTRHWMSPACLPCDAAVVLSGRDAIVPSRAVREYLEEHRKRLAGVPDAPQLEVEWKERWHHGWVAIHPRTQRRLVDRLASLMVHASPSARAASESPYPVASEQ